MDFNHLIYLANQAAHLFRPAAGQHAYLDPGSGSFLLQLLVAFLVGGLFLLKTYWAKVKNFARRLFNKQESTEDDE